jgi:hypothetical protein
MKKLIFLLTAGFLAVLMVSCNEAPSSENNGEAAATEEKVGEVTEAMAKAPAADWDEAKEAYHEIMADVFHSAEEGNLEPLKTRAEELGTAAQEWNKLQIPEALKTPELEKAMKDLEMLSMMMPKVVDKGADEGMVKAITGLHDVFHKVVGLCNHDEQEHAEGEAH